jgi:hypothetical protein
VCVPIVITTTEEAERMLEILDDFHKAAQRNDYAKERAKKIKWLDCTCCGRRYRGRQWFNQDCGTGLGDCCVEYCQVDPTPGVESPSYGVAGIHYLISASEET